MLQLATEIQQNLLPAQGELCISLDIMMKLQQLLKLMIGISVSANLRVGCQPLVKSLCKV